MQLKLKEDPKEWRNFMLLFCLAAAILALLNWRREKIAVSTLEIILALAVAIASTAAIAPRLFRPVYRTAMTASFYIGQVMQRVLLTLVYLLIVTPLALVLKAIGKDLLEIKKPAPSASTNGSTFWKEPRPPGPLNQQF